MPIIDINIILLIALFAWHYSLRCGYISDDHAAVAERKDIIPDSEKVDRGESFWVKRFNDGLIMFYQTRLFWKLGFKNKPFFWHLLSLVVHLVNTYLVYLFFLPLYGESVACIASGFWSVNPMLNQNVVWISGRPYLFGTCLALIALISWQDPICFSIFYILAVITNISVFFVPVLLAIIYPCSKTFSYILIMLAGAVPFLIWKFNKRFKNGLVIDRDNFKFKLRKFNTFATTVLYYVWTIFVPVRMGWYHQAGFRYNERWERFNYITLMGYLLVFTLLFYFKLPGWWFLICLLPNANLYATNSFLQDRYLYFCSIGIALIVAPFLVNYPSLFYCAMTFYVTRTYMYSRNLKNDELLYRENWRNHPHSDYAVNNLSYFLIQQRRYDEARVIIERGLNICNSNKMLWYNLGITYAAQGHLGNDEGKFKFIKALECWKTCLALEPRWLKPAEDLKKLIKLLIDNKVITLNKNESNGVQISVPNIIGMQNVMEKAT